MPRAHKDTIMIGHNEYQVFKTQAEKRPFEVGYESGLSHQTLFDCPYGHATEQDLRKRNEWLDGYLTASANSKSQEFY